MGFFLYRADVSAADGGNDSADAFVPISGLLESKDTGGGIYGVVDRDVRVDQAYTYLLVEQKIGGQLIRYEDLITVVGVGTELHYRILLPAVSR